MTGRYLCVLLLLGPGLAHCGTTSFSAGGDAAGDGANDATVEASRKEAGGASDASKNDGGIGGSDSATKDGGKKSKDGGSPPPTDAGCPMLSGVYTVAIMGTTPGCTGLDSQREVCVTSAGCSVTFASDLPIGLNGEATATVISKTKGTLDFTQLQEGNEDGGRSKRTGCVASYVLGSPDTITIDCGTSGTDQACDVNLSGTMGVCSFGGSGSGS
jgi:hypothetical protein